MALLKEHSPAPEHQVATHPSQISMKGEIVRKSIHLCSIAIPTMYIWMTREQMLWLLVPATIVSFVIEILRFRVEAAERIFNKAFGSILRTHEKSNKKGKKISGATWVLFSASLCILIFPRVITIAGFTVLIVSDTCAALIGRRYGRHKFLEKSLEGSSAFVVSAIGVVLAVAAIYSAPWQFIVVGIVASIVSAAAEALSYGANIDDNLSIPISFGFTMWGLLALFESPAVRALLAL